jgi:uncharacterized protein YecE (DUF72 family)
MNISVGTASWTDKTPEARLRFSAQQFPMVEVDASYYAIPSPQTAQMWAERTPPQFTFNVKAFRLFTGHQTDRSASRKTAPRPASRRRPSRTPTSGNTTPPKA